jgi:folate-dependent phosphoribosylglycinamide formyltransferase PurN
VARNRQQESKTMTTIHYVTEMVEVETGKVTERKTWTVKAASSAEALMGRIRSEHKTSRRRGEYRCTITQMWAA